MYAFDIDNVDNFGQPLIAIGRYLEERSVVFGPELLVPLLCFLSQESVLFLILGLVRRDVQLEGS